MHLYEKFIIPCKYISDQVHQQLYCNVATILKPSILYKSHKYPSGDKISSLTDFLLVVSTKF